MQRCEISEGVNFNFMRQTKFKTNFFQVCFVTDLDRKYTTKLNLLGGVLLRASKNYPGIDKINNRLDYLYDMTVSTHCYKRGERLIYSYECDYIRDDFLPRGDENLTDEAVGMFKEIVFNPYIVDGGFDKKILESEKTDLANAIKSVINYKNTYAKEKCIEHLCEGEKFSISDQGNLEDIDGITAEELYDFYNQFINSARIEIFFVGDGENEKLCESFKKIFSEIPDRKTVTLCDTFVTGKPKDELREVTEEMDVNQGKLALGFKTGITVNDSDSTALSLFSEIFGGSPMSKLFMNVREKLSLCYYCRTSPDAYKGIMLVLSGIECENKEKAFDAIMKELSDIQNGIVSEDEFEAAKLSLINSYKTIDDSPAALSTWFASRIINGSFLEPCEVVEQLNRTTLSEVVEVSKKVKLDTVYFLKGFDKAKEA